MRTYARCGGYSVISLLMVSAGVAGPSLSVPFVFEKNAGQVDQQVRYFGRTQGAGLWLVDSGVVLSLDQKNRRAVLRMNLEGARPHPGIEGTQPLEGKSNYFTGSDPAKWHKDIGQYGAVRYQDAYPGVDLVFHASAQTIEYDWIVSPGADPRQIKMSFQGASEIRIDRSGDLVLRIGDVEVREKRPHIFQDEEAGRREIDGRFVRHGRAVGFEVADFDRSRTLTIDPVLEYATHLGGSGNASDQAGDQALSVAMDSAGNAVVVGTSFSTNFPTKTGLYPDPGAIINGFIAKVNPAGSLGPSIVWATYFGGSVHTEAESVALDSTGNVYVTGLTYASNIPIQGGFQTTNPNSANAHAFVAKLSAAGDKLIYSSYLGGARTDVAYSIAVDSTGSAWVAGATNSGNFPVKGNAYNTFLKGSQDGFVSRVSADGSQLLYSTYLGGETAALFAITVDGAGSAYVAGYSASPDFPIVNGYQPVYPSNAVRSGVVAKINPSATSSLVYSTYLGGATDGTILFAISVDGKGNIYVGGRSASPEFPVTANAVQTVASFPNGQLSGTAAVVAELNPAAQAGAQLEYSTYLGGGTLDEVLGIGLDSSGRIVVGGTTGSPTFPTTPDAFQAAFLGTQANGTYPNKGFLSVIDPTLSGTKGLVYSTLLGGHQSDTFNALGVNAAGTTATIVGQATSSDLFVTASAFQPKLSSPYGDAFIATFNLAQSGPVLSSMVNAASFATHNTNFAPGEIVTLFGSNLGPEALVGAELDPTGHLSNMLSGCQFLVDGTPAPLVYVQAGQVSAILPYELTPQIGGALANYAQMVCNGVGGNVIEFAAVAADPAIFSATQTGQGQAAILNQDGTYNSASNPASGGSIVQIFATGEGVLSPAGEDGRIENGPVSGIPTPALPVTVTFGGTVSPKLTYAGVAPGEVDGLLQIDAQVPTGLTPGNVPIVVTIGTTASPQGLTIAVK
jgi:uncharacterized protein (TIGR03437 family)